MGVGSIEVDSLVVGAVERVKFETLAEQASSYLIHFVLVGLASATLQVLGLLQTLPVLLHLSVVGIDLQSLSDVLFCQIVLSIVKEDATAPEEEDCTVHEALLDVVCHFN